MSVRIIAPRNLGRRLIEALLLTIGIGFLGYYFYSYFYRLAYQAYAEWRFEQEIAAPARPPARASKSPVVPASLPNPDRAPITRGPDAGSILGRISIPRLHLSAIVEEGVDEHTLSRAVGHVPGTSLPGDPGNAAVAGHRDTFFRELRDLRPNDKIDVTTHEGRYHYVVDSLTIVDPSDVAVLKSRGRGRSLTLVTCFPFEYIGNAPRRFVVHAVLE